MRLKREDQKAIIMVIQKKGEALILRFMGTGLHLGMVSLGSVHSPDAASGLRLERSQPGPHTHTATIANYRHQRRAIIGATVDEMGRTE